MRLRDIFGHYIILSNCHLLLQIFNSLFVANCVLMFYLKHNIFQLLSSAIFNWPQFSCFCSQHGVDQMSYFLISNSFGQKNLTVGYLFGQISFVDNISSFFENFEYSILYKKCIITAVHGSFIATCCKFRYNVIWSLRCYVHYTTCYVHDKGQIFDVVTSLGFFYSTAAPID